PYRRDRAARGSPGPRVPEATHARAGCGAYLRGRAGGGPGTRGGPAHERGDRAGGRRDSHGRVRSRRAGSGMSAARVVRAPRGSERSCRGWIQEAALRMLMNNLDPEVAERPADLVVYGGTGKAARDWPSFEAICRTLRTLADDETLLVQSGKPAGVFATHPDAPRVLIANANLVGRWARWDVFRDLDRRGLIMFGQMNAGSWIYSGKEGLLQGTYETLGRAARVRPRRAHRADVGARSPERVCAGRPAARGRGGAAAPRSRRVSAARGGEHRHPRPRDAGAAARWGRRLRLWQQHPHRRGGCGAGRRLRHSRLCAGIHPAAVLRGPRAVPLGRAVRRPQGTPSHGPTGARVVSGERAPATLDYPGP